MTLITVVQNTLKTKLEASSLVYNYSNIPLYWVIKLFMLKYFFAVTLTDYSLAAVLPTFTGLLFSLPCEKFNTLNCSCDGC